MHYYQFNIADYRKDTTHLSRLEHGIYRDLIDWYYLDESPIQLETQSVMRRLRLVSDEEAKALENVLSDFFVIDDGWRHRRIDQDIIEIKKAQKNHWGAKLPKSTRCAIQAERNATKINATPKWLTREQKNKTAEFYAESALLTASSGIPHEVDHIVPLRGKTVCGLHVHWNLRVIEAHKNRAKSNSLEVA